MQAWVLNNGQGAKTAPTGSHGYYDGSGSPPQKGHVYHQSQPAPVHPILAHDASPPTSQPYQSRRPIVNANANAANRVAATSVARYSTSRAGTGRPGHAKETSMSVSRNRAISSEPLQHAQRQAPFWDGSTVDGSVFSETASIADSRAGAQHRIPFLDPAFKVRNTPRQHPIKRDSDTERPPFVIGENGMIDVLNAPLIKSTSTPDARARASSKGAAPDPDSYIEDTHYQAASDKSPPNSLNHHRARLPLRATKRESYSERTSYPSSQNVMSSPPDQAYQTPGDGLEYVPQDDRGHLRVPDHGPHRSTMFENIDTPLASHPDSDVESIEDQPTPKPAPKSSPPVNRTLFSKDRDRDSKGSKGRNSLRESSMPRPASEKRHSTAKKRQFDLDYDDGALAAMKYSELKKQNFDYDPAQAESQSAQRPPQGTLPEKLNHFLDKDQDAQATFFMGMPVRDWDDSGDWFLERFGDIMHRLKDARRAKRDLVDGFETEIAEREEAVRRKIHGIGQTLENLKSEGQVLMEGKELD
ncbi:extracellular mutant protein 11-domain-containing protein [Xylariales sp. AK1849]|nr:extracellular mutant protein 11-domain-containing protein [Xylariales sp. AK1849]